MLLLFLYSTSFSHDSFCYRWFASLRALVFFFFLMASTKFFDPVHHHYQSSICQWLIPPTYICVKKHVESRLIKYKRRSSNQSKKRWRQMRDDKHCHSAFLSHENDLRAVQSTSVHTNAAHTHANRCFKINTDFSIYLYSYLIIFVWPGFSIWLFVLCASASSLL